MPPLLLKTKLFLPPLRPGWIARQRLQTHLDEALLPGVKVVLVSAPPGFGKTTLVAQWLANQKVPYAWLSLDQADNHLPIFFRYLIAALQVIDPAVGASITDLDSNPRLDISEIITSLANDLAESPQSFIVVLDDCHILQEPAVNQALNKMVEFQPAQMRLVLVTRQDPPLPLARLRARRELVELRPDDLRFNPAEAATFLTGVMGLRLLPGDIAALETRTEGWIAGLQMAALSMRGLEDTTSFIQAFSGSNRFILDYLLEEVLNRQPAPIQEFLLQTSILDRLCDPLCASVVDDTLSNNPVSLENLERENLFLIPLDSERRWYRYHHLFADLLRARVKAIQPDMVARLHRRAALWFNEHDEPAEAVEHALAAGDYNLAVDIHERNVVARWRLTDFQFLNLIHRIPKSVIFAHPSLCLQQAWMNVITGKIDDILPLIEASESILISRQQLGTVSEEQRGLLAFGRVLRAYLDDFRNISPRLDDDLIRAIDLVPEDNIGMRNSIAVVIGSIYMMEGQFEQAARYYADAIRRDQAAGGTNAVPIATTRWARMLILNGNLREAERLCREAADYVKIRGAQRFYVSGNINLLLGDILRQRNDLASADVQIQEGLALNSTWPVPQNQCIGVYCMARLALSQGDLERARAAIDEGLAFLQVNQIYHETASVVEAAAVRLWCAENNRSKLIAWLDRFPPGSFPSIAYRFETWRIIQARVLLALGYRPEAVFLLEEQARAAESGRRIGNLIEILCLLAIACAEDAPHALALLEKALQLAEPEGFVRVFLDEGEPIHQLLMNLKATDHKPAAFTRYLLDQYPPVRGETSSSVRQALPEPLSERELEVLKLAANGLTNQQIAARLVISIRTVKKHMENIHGKLGVENRTQAAARARQAGLID